MSHGSITDVCVTGDIIATVGIVAIMESQPEQRVGRMMNNSPLENELPWTKPWYWFHRQGAEVFLYLALIHALSLVGLALFPLPGWGVLLTAVLFASLGGFGTTLAYHRSLAHRSLKLHPWLEQFLIFCAVFNGSGVPSTWTANHRHHHARADTVEDVSSPRHGGFWWAHLRWLYQWPPSKMETWCPDLMSRRYLVWDRLHQPILLLSLVSGALLFGWAGFFWIGAIRLTYSLHLQAAVNSVLHMKPGLPEGVDSARNIWWLGPLQLTAWGENWHENHHAVPGSARFSRHWWQVDVGWYAIRLLRACGLATAVRS